MTESTSPADEYEFTSRCLTCDTGIHWIECPTGGWWAHDMHPADNHDAVSPVHVMEDVDDRGNWFSVGIESETTDA